MPCVIELCSKAQQRLREMPGDLRAAVIDKLRDGADALIRSAVTPPYPPGYWVHEFFVENPPNPDDLRWFVAILIARSGGGRKLHICSLPFRAVPQRCDFTFLLQPA